MTPGQMEQELIHEAGGSIRSALRLAVRRLAVAGYCISAGYIRSSDGYGKCIKPMVPAKTIDDNEEWLETGRDNEAVLADSDT